MLCVCVCVQAYVLSCNVYLLDVSDAGSSPIPITSDDDVRHGIPDWAYEGTCTCVTSIAWPGQ